MENIDTIDIIDFGGQYTNLISKNIRKLRILNKIYPFHSYKKPSPQTKMVILSGSPHSVTEENHPYVPFKEWNIPVLGICYGAQLIAKEFGCNVIKSENGEGEFGYTVLDNNMKVWMSHNDFIIPSENINILLSTNNIPVAGFKVKNTDYYGVQFHPEVTHTENGDDFFKDLIEKFKIEQTWITPNILQVIMEKLEPKVNGRDVLMAISGGVDSAVASQLIKNAGGNVECVLVDIGLLRKNEVENIKSSIPDLVIIDKQDSTFKELKGIIQPERKRKIIGKIFIDTFEEYVNKYRNIKDRKETESVLLGQGTIYPDVIESLGGIKSHHNVGGLPDNLQMEIIEPLRELYKEEVREIGILLGLPENIIYRYPFPGPGLAIRIIGEVTLERVKTLQEADFIYMNMLKKYKSKSENIKNIWQAGTILIPDISVGVTGDKRNEGSVIILRAVNSIDGMTAESTEIDIKLLKKISTEITNKVTNVNRVLYDLTNKPPGTIEFQ